MQIKVKKLHPDARIPQYAKPGDAGMDLYCVSYDKQDKFIQYNTGLAFEIPEGYFGLLVPRSSNSKYDMLLSNSAGILDSGYRGEVSFRYRRHYRQIDGLSWVADIYSIGDRIGQILILPYPHITYVEAEELSESERGVNGYGSTGR